MTIRWGALRFDSPYKNGGIAQCPHCSRHVQFQAAQLQLWDKIEEYSSPWDMMEAELDETTTAREYILIGSEDYFHREIEDSYLNIEENEDIPPKNHVAILESGVCGACGGLVLTLGTIAHPTQEEDLSIPYIDKLDEYLIWPRPNVIEVPNINLPPGVPDDLLEDYREAATLLAISPKASAALTRRCLEELLTKQGIKGKPRNDLAGKIAVAIEKLPSDIAEALNLIRHFGNFAAHTQRHVSSGEIISVEPGEAEFSLGILHWMLKHYYERPWGKEENFAKMKQNLETKLKAVGKL